MTLSFTTFVFPISSLSSMWDCSAVRALYFFKSCFFSNMALIGRMTW